MSLTARLMPGYVSIYGGQSIAGINAPNGYQFGLVDQLLSGGSGTVIVGQSVLFKVNDSIVVSESQTQYFLIQENNIILVEGENPT